jgi:hypothetical protein
MHAGQGTRPRIEEASSIPPQIHLVWRDFDDAAPALAEKIADIKACGRAKEGDQFVTVEWTRPEWLTDDLPAGTQ